MVGGERRSEEKIVAVMLVVMVCLEDGGESAILR
jgi:hypothetical protein